MSQLAGTGVETRRYRVAVDACGRTETGPIRAQNQDAIVVGGAVTGVSGTTLAWCQEIGPAGFGVAVVDGMGGHAGGAEAAALVASALAAADPGPEGWDSWFEDVSRRVSLAGAAWGTSEMGATAAVLRVTSSGMVMANVGDCRIYRAVGGWLGQISVDDRTDDPASSAVTQAVGGTGRLNAHLWHQEFTGGPERYLLCSDGVWGTLDPAVLRELCSADRPPAQIVAAIAASIHASGATDNCSVVVLDLVATESTALSPRSAESPLIEVGSVAASETWTRGSGDE